MGGLQSVEIIRVLLGYIGDSGKENGSSYLGSIGFRVRLQVT